MIYVSSTDNVAFVCDNSFSLNMSEYLTPKQIRDGIVRPPNMFTIPFCIDNREDSTVYTITNKNMAGVLESKLYMIDTIREIRIPPDTFNEEIMDAGSLLSSFMDAKISHVTVDNFAAVEESISSYNRLQTIMNDRQVVRFEKVTATTTPYRSNQDTLIVRMIPVEQEDLDVLLTLNGEKTNED